MSDTNYIASIVKILETPKQKFFNNKILVRLNFEFNYPQVRNTIIVNLVFGVI
jgi:hypothetical protein